LCGLWNGVEADCPSYCQLMSVNCPGTYASNVTCLTVCATWPAGHPGDTILNTESCREYYANQGPASCGNASPSSETCVTVTQYFNCQQYCAKMQWTCVGPNAQFSSMAACLAECAVYPPGTTGDTVNNTLQCRYHHLVVANASAASSIIHCPHAGPYGGGFTGSVCGINLCDNYCNNMMASCPSVFGSQQHCVYNCSQYDMYGTIGDFTGDSLQCRENNALYATIHGNVLMGYTNVSMNVTTNGNTTLQLVAMPLYPCASASPNGGYGCVGIAPGCATYCNIMWSDCSDQETQTFPSMSQCMKECQLYPAPYTLTASQLALVPTLPDSETTISPSLTGNSLQCRLFNALVAQYASMVSSSSSVYCANALPQSPNLICGSICDHYCNLMSAACPFIFNSDTTCGNVCNYEYMTQGENTANMPSGSITDTTGDTIYCRYYYAVQSLMNYPSPLCFAAGPNSTRCVNGGGDNTLPTTPPGSHANPQSAPLPFALLAAFAALALVFFNKF